ncbi:hypothetical protein R1flu_019728 [Riccia fluitans]|uniref:CCHC-type domain-containing protein n=1 Tax=Riccia fluitans TaxID=41844 RepID=A0ABD1ZJH1_9MARC
MGSLCSDVSSHFPSIFASSSICIRQRYEEALGILEKYYPNGKEAVAYIRAIDPRKFSRYALVLPSQAIPPITEQDLASSITCRASEAAVCKGRARTVRIPNGGGTSRRHREYMYPVRDEPRLINSQGPHPTTSEEAASPSTQNDRGKSTRKCGVCRETGHHKDTYPVKKQADALRAQYFTDSFQIVFFR